VEALDKICQGFLWFLLNFGQMDAGPPLLAASDELADKSISQILKARNASWS